MTDTNVSLISYTAVSKYFGHPDIFSCTAVNDKKCKNIFSKKQFDCIKYRMFYRVILKMNTKF